jgi:hypothetical protein
MKAMLDISQNTFRAVAPDLNPFAPHKSATAAGNSESPPVPPAPRSRSTPAKEPKAAEVDELKQRLAELESVVSRLSPKKTMRKKR